MLIVFCTIMFITDAYKKFDKSYPFAPLEVFDYGLSTTVSIIDNILIVDAFRRLHKGLEQESLGISKK